MALAAEFRSHPPIRPLPEPSQRPLAGGPAFFVDPARGDDTSDGSKAKPWKTIAHALPKLSAGDTLVLRGGTYFENVYCAVAGTKEKPITIRSHPGELAIVDGGLAEFETDPAQVWEPVTGGAAGEYRSVRPYKNIRDIVGLFGDSMVGLQTYWHAEDLRASNENWIIDPEKKPAVLPVYCGPGLWYDKQTGHVHVRLAHTHLTTPGLANYAGETDPRKVPLVVAPFNSVALFVDQAMHVRFQDLVFRGGGQNTVVLQFGVNVEFDEVTIFAGTYGIRARGTGPLRMANSAIRGMMAPWVWRDENSLQTYTPTSYDPFVPPAAPGGRNIARLTTHAVLVTEGSYEFEVFYYPYNHDWEISQSEFTDGHDGVYLSGRNIRFHHNWVDNFQDDAMYLSAPSPYFNDGIFIQQNLISHTLMAFGANSRGGPDGSIFIARNIADLRQGAHANRPSPKNPEGVLDNYHIFLMHGREKLGVESISFYQNTFICPVTGGDAYAHRTLNSTNDRTVRRVFNNLCVYLNRYPLPPGDRTPLDDIQVDGNLHWSPAPDAQPPQGFLEKARTCKASEHNKAKYPEGWEKSAVLGDPKFAAFGASPQAVNDYRLQPDSPAIGKGIVLPAELEDPLRPKDGTRPDIGALAKGAEPLRVGIHSRIEAGAPAHPKP